MARPLSLAVAVALLLGVLAEGHLHGNRTSASRLQQYTVDHGTINDIPGLAQGPPYSGVIYYPREDPVGQNYPFVSFAHPKGPFSWDGYVTDLSTVASYGFVVVGASSCPTSQCGARYSADQLATIAACGKHGTLLHPALAKADFTRTAVYGHSMGAMATVMSAGRANVAAHNIKAAVAQNVCIDTTAGQPYSAKDVGIPIMYTTGGADTTCVLAYTATTFSYTPRNPRVAISWNDATHLEVVDGIGKLRGIDEAARFLACHVRGEHCDTAGRAFCQHTTADLCAYNNPW